MLCKHGGPARLIESHSERSVPGLDWSLLLTDHLTMQDCNLHFELFGVVFHKKCSLPWQAKVDDVLMVGSRDFLVVERLPEVDGVYQLAVTLDSDITGQDLIALGFRVAQE